MPHVCRAQGLEQFKREHGRYPDLVVLHSNYWDIAQIVLFRWWEGWEPEYTQLMLDWLARAEKVAAYLEVRHGLASDRHGASRAGTRLMRREHGMHHGEGSHDVAIASEACGMRMHVPGSGWCGARALHR